MLRDTGEDKMIRGLIIALQFLSRLPVNIAVDFNKANIRKSTFYFPFVGLLLGLIASLVYYLLNPFNNQIASFLTLLITIVLTGGLHLDGLSDTADGFFSNKDRLTTLEIMKDSRIGAFGVISLILLILFKYILISNLGYKLPVALALSMGNSRLIVLIQIASKRIARPGGLGDMVHKSKPQKYILSSIGLYLLVVIYMDIKFLIPLIISLIGGEMISAYSYKKIGGLTGDVYGAIIELSELVSLLSFWGVFIWI